MKHYLVLGIVFLPTVFHLILFVFKKKTDYLNLFVVGMLSMSGIILCHSSLLVPEFKFELLTGLFLLLLIFLSIQYFYILSKQKKKLSETFVSLAPRLYLLAVLFTIAGYLSLTEMITLTFTGPVYFTVGFLGIQFIFFWKLWQLESFTETAGMEPGNPKAIYIINEEDKKLLTFLLEGKTDKEISELLFRSQPTVKKHLSNLYKKIGVKNRKEAALLYAGKMKDEKNNVNKKN